MTRFPLFLLAIVAVIAACGGGAPPARRVLLVGIDAADEDLIVPLVRAGRLPCFARFYREGITGSLHSHRPMLSPILWTSIATGVSPERHRILDFIEQVGDAGPAGARFAPISSAGRLRKSVWEILGDRGVRIAVAGWLATHPASPVNGSLVSDRFTVHPYESPDAEPPADPAGKSWPAALAKDLEPLRVRPSTVPSADLDRIFGIPGIGSESSDDARALRVIAATTATWQSVGRRLMEMGKPDFVAIYFEGLDRLLHVFGGCSDPPVEGTDPARAARFGKVAESYLDHLDRVLADLIAAAGQETVVLVVSDHGWKTGFDRPARDPARSGPFAAEWHDEDGVLFALGPGVRAGARVEGADLYDVAPTVLALYGAPVSREFTGRPLQELFEPGTLAPQPPAVDSYLRESSPLPREATGDRESRAALENLQKLGYVAGRAGIAGGTGPSDRSRANLATVCLDERRFSEAAELFREFLARHPDDYDALYNLGYALKEAGDGAGAVRAWQKASAVRPSSAEPWVALGELASGAGNWPSALDAFRRALQLDPRSASVWNHLGAAECETSRFDEGEKAFRRAIEMNPRGVGSWVNLSRVLERTGRKDEAIELMRQAVGTLPAEERIRRRLAELQGAKNGA